MSPDILCIQEGNAMTFELEFAFMREIGYDVVKYSKKCEQPSHPPIHTCHNGH